jgi:phosphatidylserine decarboxylase
MWPRDPSAASLPTYVFILMTSTSAEARNFTWLQNLRALPARLGANEDLNFLFTNRIPRIFLTRLVGRISRSENAVVVAIAMRLWRAFTDLDLRDAARTDFRSVHECFTRELRPGARPIDLDPRFLTSPCDGIVGATGRIESETLLQAKGFPYTLYELLRDPTLVKRYRDGSYVTLRLTSAMYHRFHAPCDCHIERVVYISGDTWNVNPIALKRIEKLFCKNERAIIECRIEGVDLPVLLVPVAAVLVASMRFNFLDVLLNLKYRGPNVIACDARVRKGEELGRFEHGSTIIVIAPPGVSVNPEVIEGAVVRVGRPLMRVSEQ